MNALRLAFVILRRNISYALFVSFGIAFLLYVVYGFYQYSHHVRSERRQLQMVDADVIAPKGSTVEHLRRLLKLELFPNPALIPSQLYTTLTTDPPPGLKLTPVLFWGSYQQSPVIAADLKLQEILVSSFPELEHLGDREALIGQTAAARYHLKPGDRIEIESQFDHLALNSFKDQFTIKGVADLGAWNGAVLTPLDRMPPILKQIKFIPEQIWNDLILSYVFVTGPEHFSRKPNISSTSAPWRSTFASAMKFPVFSSSPESMKSWNSKFSSSPPFPLW